MNNHGLLIAHEENIRLPESKTCKERPKTVPELVAALKQCIKHRDLQGGKKLHKEAVSSASHTNNYVATALINMYSKCGSISCARDVFQNMSHRHVITWTCLITGYVENGESSAATDLFMSMDCKPDTYAYASVLKACACLASTNKELCLKKGKAIHEQLRENGLDSDVYVATTLVDMYRKCGCMLHAREVFDRMTHRDVITWNCLLLGYVENGEASVSIELLTNMDCEANSVTFVAALKACTRLGCLEKGMAIHKHIKEHACDINIVVGNTLLDMYSKCGSMGYAQRFFDKMVCRDVVSWTALILGYVESGKSLLALELFSNIECEPNSVTYTAALKACGELGSVEKGMAIHKQARERGFDKELVVGNTLLDMYGKCSNMLLARYVFDHMLRRDVVSWTCLIMGYGESSRAMELCMSMDCKPDSVTYVAALKACASLACLESGFAIDKQIREDGLDMSISVANTLIDMYSKCGSMVCARDVFDGMSYRDSVSWTCVIMGYVLNGESSVALDLFVRMDCVGNSVTYMAVLKACGNMAALRDGKLVHSQICKLGLEHDEVISNSLVDFYGKCSDMAASEDVFNYMETREIVSWNALVAGYSALGNTVRVFGLVSEICEAGLKMDGITFTCILTACSHAGMVEEGNKCFRSMSKYGVTPELDHYTCVADMLARANRAQEALSIVQSMPFQVDIVAWTTLIRSCSK